MYKASDYPELDVVKQKFGFKRSVNPLPESGDFRLDIPTQDLDDMRSEFESKFNERLADAMRAPWDRLHKMLTDMSEKLKDDGEEKKRYHDTLISNPLELCELLTKLNVTNDPKLEEARKNLERTMLGVSIEAVKESAYEREQLKTKVDEILGKFNW
jgi:biotin synthase-related radical SAM superfamily protein